MFSIFRRHSPTASPPESPLHPAGPSTAGGPMGPADLRQRASPISSRPRFREDEGPHAQATMRPRQASPTRPSTSAAAASTATPAQASAAAALAFGTEVEQWRQRAARLAPQVSTAYNYDYGQGHDARPGAVNDVAERIRAAAARRDPRLEIDSLPAIDMPQAIGQLSNLRHLSVKATECQRLPDSIGDLSDLRELVLANNRALTRLPDSITNLGRLETLVAHLTPLRTLPLQIGSLSRLTTLSLSGGTYEALPTSFTDLSRLKTLEISRSRPERQEMARRGAPPGSLRKGLTTLPADFGKLRSLRQLTLSDHAEFTHIPASLYNLPNLRELTLSKCPKLTALPATGMQPLHHLAKLDLSHNTGLTALPDGFGQLPRLQELHLMGNKGLTHLPDVAGLAQLRTLNLEGCLNLTALPHGLGGLGTLRELNLRRCHHLPVQDLEAVVASLPRECQVTMPSGEQRTGGPRPVRPPRVQEAVWMNPFFDAPRVQDPAHVTAWKTRLAPFSGEDPNGRFAQWMDAACRGRLTDDDIGRMDRIVDTVAASPAFRAKVFDFAAQHVILERDDMGMTLGAVPPRTITTVRDMHNLLVEHALSDRGGIDAVQARQMLAGAVREQYPRWTSPRPPNELVGDPPPAVVVPGRHVRPPWPPLAAYVRTHDPEGRKIIERADTLLGKLQAAVGLQADEEAGSSGATPGPKGTPKPRAVKPAINEGEYRKRSDALMQSRDQALHERYIALATELLRPPRADAGASPRR